MFIHEEKAKIKELLGTLNQKIKLDDNCELNYQASLDLLKNLEDLNQDVRYFLIVKIV